MNEKDIRTNNSRIISLVTEQDQKLLSVPDSMKNNDITPAASLSHGNRSCVSSNKSKIRAFTTCSVSVVLAFIVYCYVGRFVISLKELHRANEDDSEVGYEGPSILGVNTLTGFGYVIVGMIVWSQIALIFYDPGFITDENIKHVCEQLNVLMEGKSKEDLANELNEKYLQSQGIGPPVDVEATVAESQLSPKNASDLGVIIIQPVQDIDRFDPPIMEYLARNKVWGRWDEIGKLMRFKYCEKCDQIKPPRTHHCSCCDRCVQKMDHHCPWVGTCVGLRNHKLFIVFLGWTTLGLFFSAVSMAPLLPRIFDKTKRDKVTELGILNLTDSVLIGIAILFCVMAVFVLGQMFAQQYWFVSKSLCTIEMSTLGAENHVFSGPDNWTTHFGKNKWMWLLPIPPMFEPDAGIIWNLNKFEQATIDASN